MQFMFLIPGVFALLRISAPAWALNAWSQTVERGLPVFSIGTPRGALRVICDPDRVFGPTPNGGAAARFAEDADPAMIVFLANSGEQARLPVKTGMAAQAAADPAEWTKMVAILQAGGAFAVVTSLESVMFETPALPDLACD